MEKTLKSYLSFSVKGRSTSTGTAWHEDVPSTRSDLFLPTTLETTEPSCPLLKFSARGLAGHKTKERANVRKPARRRKATVLLKVCGVGSGTPWSLLVFQAVQKDRDVPGSTMYVACWRRRRSRKLEELHHHSLLLPSFFYASPSFRLLKIIHHHHHPHKQPVLLNTPTPRHCGLLGAGWSEALRTTGRTDERSFSLSLSRGLRVVRGGVVSRDDGGDHFHSYLGALETNERRLTGASPTLA